MRLIIPGEMCEAARLSGDELKQEIAISLLQKEKLMLGQGGGLAGMR